MLESFEIAKQSQAIRIMRSGSVKSFWESGGINQKEVRLSQEHPADVPKARQGATNKNGAKLPFLGGHPFTTCRQNCGSAVSLLLGQQLV